MTQIDLLEEELQKLEVKYISMILEYRKEKRLIFEKYKEVHKQQIIDAYKIGECEVGLMIVNKPEQYYNETYGSKGSDENFKQFSLYEHKETITSSDTKVSETFLDHVPDVRNMVSSQTEISDEEIIKLANEHILYNDSKRQWVIEGMKLYREHLKINN